MISKALIWVLKHQTEDGSFYDVSWFPDRKVNSSLPRMDYFTKQQRFSNISLTAQVLITLSNAKDLSGVSYMQIFLYNLNLINIYKFIL